MERVGVCSGRVREILRGGSLVYLMTRCRSRSPRDRPKPPQPLHLFPVRVGRSGLYDQKSLVTGKKEKAKGRPLDRDLPPFHPS